MPVLETGQSQASTILPLWTSDRDEFRRYSTSSETAVGGPNSGNADSGLNPSASVSIRTFPFQGECVGKAFEEE